MASVTILLLNGDEVKLYGGQITMAEIKVAAAKKLGAYAPEIKICLESGDQLPGPDHRYVFTEPATPITTIAMKRECEMDERFWVTAMNAHAIAEDMTGATEAVGEIPREALDRLLGRYVETGFANTVNVLLGAGANANYQARGWHNVLTLATFHGHAKIVIALLGAGANAKLDTALTMAAFKGDTEIAIALLGARANVNHKKHNSDTALTLATRGGHLHTVNALLEAGANANHKKYDFETPLTLAAWNGHAKIVIALLRAGADTAHKKCDSDTALSMATRNGHVKTVYALRCYMFI